MKINFFTNKTLGLIIFFFLINSCKSVKVLPDNSPIKDISIKTLTKKFDNRNISIKNFRARIKVNYNNQKRNQSLFLNLRIKNKEAIWISANMLVPIAKALITSNEISFYEKFQKTFINEEIDVINKYLGSDFNILDIQNIFLGNPISDFKKVKFKRISNPNYYVLSQVKDENYFQPTYFFDPTTFLLKEQRFFIRNSGQQLTITYRKHQLIYGIKYPKQIEISLLNKESKLSLSLEFIKIDFPKDLGIPFKIPEGYKKINL